MISRIFTPKRPLMLHKASYCKRILRFYSFFTFLLYITLNASAQTNAYKFIEPNISFSYDSTQVKITNNYSNSFYNTEAFDFSFYKDRGTKSFINVTAGHPLPNVPDVRFIDSMMLDGIKEIRNGSKGKQVVKYDTVIRHINTFSCVGFIMYDKANKVYGTNITCNHLSDNDATEVQYHSFTDTSLETGYKRLETFLPGFKSYSRAEIQKEEVEIQKTYKVIIKKNEKVSDEDRLMRFTFTGIVEIIPKPSHKIYGAMVSIANNMQALFQPDKENIIHITDRDLYTTGVIRKTGKLILLNSFGKKVEIPFSFEYTR